MIIMNYYELLMNYYELLRKDNNNWEKMKSQIALFY